MKKWLRLLPVLLVVGLVIGCFGGGKAPRIHSFMPSTKTVQMEVYDWRIFSVEASDPDGGELEYSWECSNGKFVGENGDEVYWYAPGIVGRSKVEVTVHGSKGGTASHEWKIDVRDPFYIGN